MSDIKSTASWEIKLMVLCFSTLFLVTFFIVAPWWLLSLAAIVIISILYFLISKSTPSTETEISSEADRSTLALTKLRKLPLLDRLAGGPYFDFMQKELLWLSNKSRSISLSNDNADSEMSDIQSVMDSVTNFTSSSAQAMGNATAFAPLVDKIPNVPEFRSKDDLVDFIEQKKRIRSDLVSQIVEFNERLDNLVVWRTRPLLSQYLDKLNYPGIESFPSPFNTKPLH